MGIVTLCRVGASILFFVGVGLLSAGVVMTASPFCIAGVLTILAGGLLGVACNVEARRR
jgi:hypothetical protein